MTEQQIIQHGAWIWLGSKDATPDSFAAFRRKFTLESVPAHLYLALSADSQFSLYINGKVIPSNQFSDYPESKTYTHFDITSFVKKGENQIAVLVHYLGDDFLRDIKGYPGLWAVLHDDEKVLDATSSSWLACRAPGFVGMFHCRHAFPAPRHPHSSHR